MDDSNVTRTKQRNMWHSLEASSSSSSSSSNSSILASKRSLHRLLCAARHCRKLASRTFLLVRAVTKHRSVVYDRLRLQLFEMRSSNTALTDLQPGVAVLVAMMPLCASLTAIGTGACYVFFTCPKDFRN